MKPTSHIKATAIVVLALSLSTLGSGQQVIVRSKIDTTSILTGDQTYFRITVEKPVDLEVSLQQFKDSLVKGIEIVRGPLRDTVLLPDNIMSVQHTYLITSFDSGRYEIPPVYTEMINDDGIKRFYSDYLYLIVNRPDITPPDTTMKYFDIIGPYKVPVSIGEILPWLLIMLIAGVAGWFIYRYLKNRNKLKEGIIPEEPQELAYILAYRSLEKLKNEKLWQKGLFKEYYSALSEILRTYIDSRFSMNSLESTTGEILFEILERNYADDEPVNRLKQVLELSDMVKFAKYLPDSTDCELSMEQSWGFVSLTRKEYQADKIGSEVIEKVNIQESDSKGKEEPWEE